MSIKEEVHVVEMGKYLYIIYFLLYFYIKKFQSINSTDLIWNVELYSYFNCIFKFLLSDSQAYFESMIYLNHKSRENNLQNMETADGDLIELGNSFLANMKEAMIQQKEFIEKFGIQPDFDERNEMKIGKNIQTIYVYINV